jgi:hypothetical protein
MNHRTRAFSRAAGAFGVVGGVAVLLGTYWISWFSLSGLTSSNVHSYGGFALYHLQTFVTSGWYTYASQVMGLGAVILVVSGIVAVFAPETRPSKRGCAVGLAVGSVIVLVAAFATGLPHWFTAEPLNFTRGAGEWVCVVGAVLGLIGCVMTATTGSVSGKSQVEASASTPTALVG